VTSFDRKSPGSACRRPKTGVYCTFHFLQGCSSQGEPVTWQEMTSRDLRWPEVTRKWRHLTVSPGSGCRRPKTGVYCAFHFVQGCSSQEEAVTWQEMTSRDLKWPEVTRKWRDLTGSHLEVAVEAENWRIVYISLPTRLYIQLASGGSHLAGNDLMWPQVSGS